MSLTPLININLRIFQRIFEKIRNGPNGIFRCPRDTDLWKNLKAKISCQTPFKGIYSYKFLCLIPVKTRIYLYVLYMLYYTLIHREIQICIKLKTIFPHRIHVFIWLATSTVSWKSYWSPVSTKFFLLNWIFLFIHKIETFTFTGKCFFSRKLYLTASRPSLTIPFPNVLLT